MDDKNRESEEQRLRRLSHYHQAERLAGLGFWDWDVSEDHLTYCSEGYARILEMTRDECVATFSSSGKDWQIVHPLDRQRYVDAEELSHDNGIGIDIEYRIITSKGNTRYIHEISEVFKNGSGEVIRSSGTVQDITERKQADETVRESEERFRDILESTSDWIWEVDKDGVYTFASEKVHNVLGYEAEEIIGQTPFDFMPPEDAERVGAEFQRIVESKKPFSNLENANLHCDGSVVVLETSGVPIFSSDGELHGYRGCDRNITERKLAEDELRASKEMFAAAFSASSDIASITNLETGQIVDISPTWFSSFGWTREEVIGKTSRDLNLWASEVEREKCKEEFSANKILRRYRVNFRTKTGEVRTCLLDTAVIETSGEPMQYSLATDITDRENMEQERLKMSKLESISVLAGGIAHDLNNLLTGKRR